MYSYIELRLALRSATAAKSMAMSGPTAGNPLDVCVAVVAICTRNAMKRQILNLHQAIAIAP
jgi:hypothetical protein